MKLTHSYAVDRLSYTWHTLNISFNLATFFLCFFFGNNTTVQDRIVLHLQKSIQPAENIFHSVTITSRQDGKSVREATAGP